MNNKIVLKALALLALCLPALAMDGSCTVQPNPSGCSGTPVNSVVVTLTVANGVTPTYGAISFNVNGGTEYEKTCSGNCDSVPLAADVTGTFNITANVVGYKPAQKTVVVVADSGGCHPVTQNVTMAMTLDDTIGALAGAWITSAGYFGTTAMRFGENGEIIGAILYNQTVGGDHNFYIAYNGHQIQGAAGQQTFPKTATDPSRAGNLFTFYDNPLGLPIGFNNAVMSADFNTLTGTLQGSAVSYARLNEIPAPLQDP